MVLVYLIVLIGILYHAQKIYSAKLVNFLLALVFFLLFSFFNGNALEIQNNYIDFRTLNDK